MRKLLSGILPCILAAGAAMADGAGFFGQKPSVASSAVFRGIQQDTKVTVQVVQRNLDMLGVEAISEFAKDVSKGVFVHTQVIVKDEKGNILDNIGYFDDSSARREEKPFTYGSEPLFEATCSYADYLVAKNAIKNQPAQYSAIAFSRKPTLQSDSARKMTLEAWAQNCQSFAEALSEEIARQPTADIKKEFRHPGNRAALATEAIALAAKAMQVGERFEEAPTIHPDPLISPPPSQQIQTPSGIVNAVPAYQTQTIDNAALKAQLSQQLEGAYQYASGIAAEAGVGAEYQSAVAPVMSQGRSAISSIPDQQTVTIPTPENQ